MSQTVRTSAQVPAALGLVCLGLVAAYWTVFVKLVADWAGNENYSHGFVIIPLAIYLGWQRRHRLAAAPRRPALAGLMLVVIGLVGLAMGTLGAELFVARISMLPVLAGVIVFLFGWGYLCVLAFPVALLLLMIPIPAIIFNEIALPLQLMASRFGESALWLCDIPVLRQGNIITLANTTLEVAEACSGIRSLVSLLTLSIVYVHFLEGRQLVRLALVMATVPIAVLTNGLRVAAIGIAAHYYGPAATEGLFHSASGWLVFVIAFVLLVGLQHLLCSVGRRPAPTADPSFARPI